jgi:hypothetical protein
MKANEQTFIDKWIIYASDSNLDELSLNYDVIKDTNNLEINGIFLTTLFKGEFFDIINEDDPKYCQTSYKFIFPFIDKKPNINSNYSLLLENVNNVGNIFISLDNFTIMV